MLILGITNNDTAGACIIRGSEIIAAVHEERFTRIKAHKTWPTQSIGFVLSAANKTINDVDIIAYGWKAGFNENHCLNLYVERVINECIYNFDNIDILQKRIADEINNDKEKREEFDRFIWDNHLQNKVRYIDHHDTHAWGAWLCSPFEQALVVTCDGRGDFISLSIRYINEGKETVLHRETTIDSLGYFYGRITHLLGFKANRHEGKITGLSAYGNPEHALPLMKKMIDIKYHRLVANCGDYYSPSYHGYLIKGVRRFISQLEKSEVRLGLVTSSWPGKVNTVLQQHQLNVFDCIITRNEVSRGKPDPLPYRTAIERLNIEPDFSLVFEDSNNGITSALAAGMNCIAVNNRTDKSLACITDFTEITVGQDNLLCRFYGENHGIGWRSKV